jgi:hypothetical protein
MARPVEHMIDRFLAALRGKLLAHPGTFTEAEKLTIEAYRKPDDTFDISIGNKAR